MINKKNNIAFIIYAILFFLVFIFIFRNLVFNINKNLISQADYLFVIWQIYQNINKILTLDFLNFFNINAFYPNKLTLLFSDTLLPQSILALPLSLITNNRILVFNILFIFTFLLDYLSLFLFWQKLFKNDLISFIGSIFFIFSPYFHLQLGHFQMLSYWPFFFSLYFLLKNKEKKAFKNIFYVGFFLAIQFLASVYIAYFLAFMVFIFYLVYIPGSKQKKEYIKEIILIFLIFFILDGVFIKNYISVKSIYQIKRDTKEYIQYSAHLSDYFFTSNINSLLHKSFFLNKWNSLDKHSLGEKSSFPGFLFSTLFLIGLFSINFRKGNFNILVKLNKERLFFIILLLSGFYFSLGPRLSFNGNYAHIPTVYHLILNGFPLIQPIRALARWSFLFYLSIVYFNLLTVEKFLKSNSKLLFSFIFFLIFIIEYLPLNLKSSYFKNEIAEKRNKLILKEVCRTKKKVLLEIPFTHLDAKGGIVIGLNYINSVLLSSLEHKCYLINGYSGVDLQSVFFMRDEIYEAINKKDLNKFLNILKANKINFVKINKKYLLPEIKLGYDNFINYFKNSFYFNNLKLKNLNDYDLIIIN